MKLIKLTLHGGDKILVNADRIIYIKKFDNVRSLYFTQSAIGVDVKETLQEIEGLING